MAEHEKLDRRKMMKAAAATGIGAAAALTVTGSAEAHPTVQEKNAFPSRLPDLIRDMAQDSNFAADVIATPEAYQESYGLSGRTVLTLRGLKLDDFAGLTGQVAESFANGAIVSASLARADFGHGPVQLGPTMDSCYYFG